MDTTALPHTTASTRFAQTKRSTNVIVWLALMAYLALIKVLLDTFFPRNGAVCGKRHASRAVPQIWLSRGNRAANGLLHCVERTVRTLAPKACTPYKKGNRSWRLS